MAHSVSTHRHADARFENHGSIWLFRPLTQAACDWLAAHCPPDEEHQHYHGSLAVDCRYVVLIYEAASADGLDVHLI
jgi:hypothetical protein